MIVGCYDLELYCDNGDNGEDCPDYKSWCMNPNGTFTGYDRAEAYRKARSLGWRIGKEKCYCPKCSGKHRPHQQGPG